VSAAKERLDAALAERKAARELGIPKTPMTMYVDTERMLAADQRVLREAWRSARIEMAKQCLEDAVEAVGQADAIPIAVAFLQKDLDRGVDLRLPKD